MTTRLSVNINDETAEALKSLAARRQTTVTEIVRRAVSVYKFVEDEVVDGDKTLKLVAPHGGETIVSML
jgi:predicted transcriptional regulator